jgi:hypothetical protein
MSQSSDEPIAASWEEKAQYYADGLNAIANEHGVPMLGKHK